MDSLQFFALPTVLVLLQLLLGAFGSAVAVSSALGSVSSSSLFISTLSFDDVFGCRLPKNSTESLSDNFASDSVPVASLFETSRSPLVLSGRLRFCIVSGHAVSSGYLSSLSFLIISS